MALEKELETYHQKLPELLGDEGKWVVIHQNEVAGIFETYVDALRQGYEQFGMPPFLVKQINTIEPIHSINRGILLP